MTNPRFPIERRKSQTSAEFQCSCVYPILLSRVPGEEGYPWHGMSVGRSMAYLCCVTAIDLQGTLSWLLPSYSLSQLRPYKKRSIFRNPSAAPMQDWARPNPDALSHRILNMNMSHVDADLREPLSCTHLASSSSDAIVSLACSNLSRSHLTPLAVRSSSSSGMRSGPTTCLHPIYLCRSRVVTTFTH